jgi:hypothetical protein
MCYSDGQLHPLSQFLHGQVFNPVLAAHAQVPQAQPSGSGHLAAAAGVVPQFEQVDIGVLREYLQWEFQEFVGE